jgi:TatD-related deoxyribonuclease
MESDYMDENERPGAVIGPRSVPRFTRRLLDAGRITVDEAYRIHADTPSRVYGVRIGSGPVRPDSP